MRKITKANRHGEMRIKHDGRFQPLRAGAFSGAPDGRAQLHRSWRPASHGGVKIAVASEMASQAHEFQKDIARGGASENRQRDDYDGAGRDGLVGKGADRH